MLEKDDSRSNNLIGKAGGGTVCVISKSIIEESFITHFLVEVHTYFVLSTSELILGGFCYCWSCQGVHLMHESAYPHDPHKEDGQEGQPECHSITKSLLTLLILLTRSCLSFVKGL